MSSALLSHLNLCHLFPHSQEGFVVCKIFFRIVTAKVSQRILYLKFKEAVLFFIWNLLVEFEVDLPHFLVSLSHSMLQDHPVGFLLQVSRELSLLVLFCVAVQDSHLRILVIFSLAAVPTSLFK